MYGIVEYSKSQYGKGAMLKADKCDIPVFYEKKKRNIISLGPYPANVMNKLVNILQLHIHCMYDLYLQYEVSVSRDNLLFWHAYTFSLQHCVDSINTFCN